MIRADIIVLGAGIAGVSAALHLQQRGRAVALVDRRGPGEETSYGNAGLIQREGVVPYAFPHDPVLIAKYAFNLLPESNLHWSALPRIAPFLWYYWRASTAAQVAATARALRPLVERCILEHEPFLAAAGVEALVRRTGYMRIYRSARALDTALAEDAADRDAYGVNFQPLDRAAVAAMEPSLTDAVIGGVLLPDPASVADPGAVVQAYARLFEQRGGLVLRGDARTLRETANGWEVGVEGDTLGAPEAVLALGPWADDIFRGLGYRFPFGVKRGYHQHYRAVGNATLNRPIMDAERGYVLAPMTAGIRLTTGVEFARRDAPPSPVQIARSLPAAREIFPLGEAVDKEPWLGRRPCLPDMLPIVGRAPRHRGLWFDFGHHHLGFTLGPVTGRLLAEMMTGDTPFTDPAPYRAERF
ncbi:MAG TPA: FAD-dependent oxidoreductase [Hyphomicrobiaceae bacterium]|nr:FAD-dependent oxidoreductase [Hyphomicrobiaceae bacterium]